MTEPFSVRPELVEGLPFPSADEKDGASTGSARTGDSIGLSSGPDPAALARFARSLVRLGCDGNAPVAVAVSGGGDSAALLLLAAAARPGAVTAATVDHGLRPAAAEEALGVARLCAALGVPHEILPATVVPIRGGPQASARQARYDALARWCPARWLLTGHQRDDVAETMLMRLARGAGVRGLARMRDRSALADGPILLRPLLDWSRAELAALCDAAGVRPVADPSNRDPRFDRTHARALLARTGWLDAAGLVRSAANLREADDALAWLADRCWTGNVTARDDGALEIDAVGLPHDTRRRLIERAIATLTGAPCPAEHLDGFVRRLASGRHATCAGIKGSPGPPWRLEHAPPRRNQARHGD